MTDREKFDRIAVACADAFGCTLSDILSPSREGRIADARSIAMWIAVRLMPRMSRKRIAQAFGRKDANAIVDGLRRADEIRFAPSVREASDRLYDCFYVMLGKTPDPPEALVNANVAKKHEGPIGGSTDAAWGFIGFHAQGKEYFKEQNVKFAEAMIEAGYMYMPRQGGETS